jgi:superfamily II helicase
VAIYASCQAPPTESGLQDEVAAGLLTDPSAADLQPMTPETKDRIQSVMLAFFARVCRSKSGWQQDKLSEQIVTRRMESPDDEDESQGVLGRLFE